MEPHVVIVSRVGPCQGHENSGKLDHRASGPVRGGIPLLLDAHGAERNARGKRSDDRDRASPWPPRPRAAPRPVSRIASLLRLAHVELVVLGLFGHLIAATRWGRRAVPPAPPAPLRAPCP